MRVRGREPRSAPPAMRSQKPAPKSAPPNSAYADTATNRMTATKSSTDGLPFSLGIGGKLAWTVRDVGVVECGGLRAEPATHRTDHPHDGCREGEVQRDDDEERDPYALVPGCRVFDLHVAVDDPRLPTDLRHYPARLHREHRGDARDRRDAKEQFRLGHVTTEDPREPVPHREQEQKSGETDHDVPREVDGVDLTGRRAFIRGDRIETLND